MPYPNVKNCSAILAELVELKKGMLRISKLIHDDIEHLLGSIVEIKEEYSNDRDSAKTKLENYDNKMNQLYAVLSNVWKTMVEMNQSIIDYIL